MQSSGAILTDPNRRWLGHVGYGINVSDTGIKVGNLTSAQLWKFIYQENGNLQIENIGVNGYLDDWFGGSLQITTYQGWLVNNTYRSWDMDSIGSAIAAHQDLDDILTGM